MTASIAQTGPAVIRLNFLPGLVSLPNSLAIGTVTTGAAGSAAAASVGGAAPAQTISLVIPKGDQGIQGPIGNTGAMASLSPGTVTTLAAGSAATATITGSPGSQVLNLGIPKGMDGAGSVNSVAGRTGTVVLTASDVGLANVSNTSDANKPVSTAQLAAIAPLVVVQNAGWSVMAADLGRLFVYAAASSAAATVALPSGAAVGAGFSFRLRNSSLFTLTLAPNGSDTIDLPKLLAKQDCRVVWDGSGWEMIGAASRVLLATNTINSGISLDFVLPADFTSFELSSDGVSVSSNGIVGGLLSLDGSIYKNGGSDYAVGRMYPTGGATGAQNNAASGSFDVTGLMLAGNPIRAQSRVSLFPGAAAAFATTFTSSAVGHPTDGMTLLVASGSLNFNGRATNLRLVTSGTNFSGTFRLSGLR